MKSFAEIIEAAKKVPACRIVVAAAEDEHVLDAVVEAKERGIAEAVLVGSKTKIETIASKMNIDINCFEIIDEPDTAKAALKAVQLVSSGQAQAVMKGLVATADMLRAVLNKEVGLRAGKNILSHVAVAEIPGFDRLIIITDAAMNVTPDLLQKAQIVQNAVSVAHAIGVECPKVACLAAVEVVNSDMPACVDAAALSKMAERGQLKGCIIDGPLALDNAVSVEAAEHKGIKSQVAGRADILMVPELVSGNVLYKSITYFAKGNLTGIIVGAKAPVIVTSRSDSAEAKLNSIALAVMAAQAK